MSQLQENAVPLRQYTGEFQGGVVGEFLLYLSPDLINKIAEYCKCQSENFKSDLKVILPEFLKALSFSLKELDPIESARQVDKIISSYQQFEEQSYSPLIIAESQQIDFELLHSHGALTLVRLLEKNLNPFLSDLAIELRFDEDTLFSILSITTPLFFHVLARSIRSGEVTSSEISNFLYAQIESARSGELVSELSSGIAQTGLVERPWALQHKSPELLVSNLHSYKREGTDSDTNAIALRSREKESKSQSSSIGVFGVFLKLLSLLLVVSALVLFLFAISTPGARDEVMYFLESLGIGEVKRSDSVFSELSQMKLSDRAGLSDRVSGNVEQEEGIQQEIQEPAADKVERSAYIPPEFAEESIAYKIMSFIKDTNEIAPSTAYYLNDVRFKLGEGSSYKDDDLQIFYLSRILSVYKNVKIQIVEHAFMPPLLGGRTSSTSLQSGIVYSALIAEGIDKSRMTAVLKRPHFSKTSQSNTDSEGYQDSRIYIRVVEK